MLRIVRTAIQTSNWVQLNDYAMVLMNKKSRGKSGVCRSELFLSRRTFDLEMPLPHEGHIRLQDRISHQSKAAQKVQEHLQRGRGA